MSGLSYTVTRIKDDTYPFEVNVRKGSGPYDLTGANVELSVGASIPDANALTMQATTIANSKATFVLTSNITSLPAGDYFGQIQVTDANGYVWTPSQFKWKVKPVI